MRKVDQLGEILERARVVREALEWVGTPYLIGRRLKGVGCDCATLLSGIFISAGFLTPDEVSCEHYQADWFAHTNDEMYKKKILRHMVEFVPRWWVSSQSLQPADLLLLKTCQTSRVFNHGAIVTVWPRVVHILDDGLGAIEVDSSTEPLFMGAERKFYSFWELTGRSAAA